MLALALGGSGLAHAGTITFAQPASQTYGTGTFTVTASSDVTSKALTITSSTTGICTIASSSNSIVGATRDLTATINILAAGSCTLTVKQTGSTSVSRTVTIDKAGQSITFNSLPNRTDAANPFSVSATASSGLAVTFSSLTSSTCTVSGNTVSVVADGTCTVAADQAGNANYSAAPEVTQSFTIGPFCVPPPNVPNSVSVTCVCDTFKRASLNPSPMFGGTNWVGSYSDTTGVAPYINQTTGLLRLTENTGNNAKAATAPGIYPAAGNYISVEFNHYAYNGTGADGVGVILSDSKISAVPGGYGGSQGYAPEGTPGFAGGWLGVALDEYGNYSNPTEGRNGGTGFFPEEVGMRGPGSGTNGYNWITGTGTLTPGLPGIDDPNNTSPSLGYMYQVIVDARNETAGTINVAVNRDTTTFDGNNYSQLIAPFNVYSAAQTALSSGWISTLVPNYWQLSFTSSTGGSNNIHEIGNVRICAQTVFPPSGGQASGFSAIDSWYPTSTNGVPAVGNFQTGDIFMKLQGTPFQLWVGALTANGGGVQYAYSATQAKYVLLKLVNNAGGGICGPDSARTCNSTCTGQAAVPGGSQILTFSTNTSGAVKTSPITLNTAYSDLVAVMKECTSSACTSFTSTPAACSVDSFSVRPTTVSVTSSVTNATASGSPAVAAGNPFTLTATVTGVSGQPSGYNGTLRINSSGLTANIDSASEASPWTPTRGALAAYSNSTASFPAATPDSPAVGQAASSGQFTYSEVGSFSLPAYAVYDGVTTSVDCPGGDALCDPMRKALTWTAVDSISTKGDCNANSFSNTIDSSGKYGCNFGYGSAISNIGRFTPHHYLLAASSITPRSDISCTSTLTPFSYMSEPFGISFSLEAVNASGGITQNYQGNYVKFNSMSSTAPWTAATPGTTGTMGLAMAASNYTPVGGSSACSVFFSAAGLTSYSCPSGPPPASTTNAGGSRVAVSTTPALPTMLWGSSGSPGAQGTPGIGLFTANVELLRTSAGPDGPFNTLGVGIDAVDTDSIATAGTTSATGFNLVTNNGPLSPTPDRVSLGNTATKFGRLKIQNAYGSALVPLPVPVQVQYWNGSTFLTNAQTATNTTYDSCTPISGASMQLTFQGNLAACNTYVPTTTTVNNGSALVVLPAPSGHQTGTMTMTDLLAAPSSGVACNGSNTSSAATYVNAPYLQGNWGSNPGNYNVNPNARATFGIYSGSPAVIYTRESY